LRDGRRAILGNREFIPPLIIKELGDLKVLNILILIPEVPISHLTQGTQYRHDHNALADYNQLLAIAK
jgi:hypothetical protein